MYVIFLCFFVYFQVANADLPKLSEPRLITTWSIIKWSLEAYGQEGAVTKVRVQDYLKLKMHIYDLTENQVDEMTSHLPENSIPYEMFLSRMGYEDKYGKTGLPDEVNPVGTGLVTEAGQSNEVHYMNTGLLVQL